MRPKNPEDFWSGLMFAVAGVGFAIGAMNYSMGSSVRPGPGYFPLGLGLLLGLIGLVIIGKSFLAAAGDAPLAPIRWRGSRRNARPPRICGACEPCLRRMSCRCCK